jgi:predicted RNA-binding protein Jag
VLSSTLTLLENFSIYSGGLAWILKKRWFTVASERIKSLVKSIIIPDEVDIEVAKRSPELYDFAAYNRLDNQPDREYSMFFLNLAVPSSIDLVSVPEYVKLVNELKRDIETVKIAPKYAYKVLINASNNELRILYATSHNYYERFHELVKQYDELVRSLNDMLWDTIKYIEYKILEYQAEEIRKKVYQFYNRIPAKYMDVIVYLDYNVVEIHAAMQLIGRIIGKQGSNVKQLEQLLKMKVKVREDKLLTQKYAEDHPEPPQDPEVLKLISQILPVLKQLEKKGVTLDQLKKIIETLETPEEDLFSEDEQY